MQVGNKHKGGSKVGSWGKRDRKEESRHKRAKIKTKEKDEDGIREWEGEGGTVQNRAKSKVRKSCV